MKKLYIILIMCLCMFFSIVAAQEDISNKASCADIEQAEKEGRITLLQVSKVDFVAVWYTTEKKIIKIIKFKFDTPPNMNESSNLIPIQY